MGVEGGGVDDIDTVPSVVEGGGVGEGEGFMFCDETPLSLDVGNIGGESRRCVFGSSFTSMAWKEDGGRGSSVIEPCCSTFMWFAMSSDGGDNEKLAACCMVPVGRSDGLSCSSCLMPKRNDISSCIVSLTAGSRSYQESLNV